LTVAQAGATTTGAPYTCRRVVRRATPATLTGVRGRPTRACALSTDKATPLPSHWIEATIAQATTAAPNNIRFGLTDLMTISVA
jgi:hypothetical protein